MSIYGQTLHRSLREEGGEEFARQLCRRDFHHQLLAANPELARDDLRPRDGAWRDDDEALELEGRPTGYSIVDAGMRQPTRGRTGC